MNQMSQLDYYMNILDTLLVFGAYASLITIIVSASLLVYYFGPWARK
jgi:hypothetical protein